MSRPPAPRLPVRAALQTIAAVAGFLLFSFVAGMITGLFL